MNRNKFIKSILLASIFLFLFGCTGSQNQNMNDFINQGNSSQSNSANQLLGTWQNQEYGMTFTFYTGGGYVLAAGGKSITGNYSASGSTISLTAGQNTTNYTYSLNGNQLDLTDAQGNTIPLTKTNTGTAGTQGASGTNTGTQATAGTQGSTTSGSQGTQTQNFNSGNSYSEDGIFYFYYPDGWSIDDSIQCNNSVGLNGYMSTSCAQKNALINSSGTQMNYNVQMFAYPKTNDASAKILSNVAEEMDYYKNNLQNLGQEQTTISNYNAASMTMYGLNDDQDWGDYARLLIIDTESIVVGYLLQIRGSPTALNANANSIAGILSSVKGSLQRNTSLEASLVGTWSGGRGTSSPYSEQGTATTGNDTIIFGANNAFQKNTTVGVVDEYIAGTGDSVSSGTFFAMGNTVFFYYTSSGTPVIEHMVVEEFTGTQFLGNNSTVYYKQ